VSSGVSATLQVSIDPNGNLTGDGIKTYQWDAENRLVAVLQGGTTLASFTYDGRSRRATKTVGGTTHSYVYAGANIAEERLSSGQTLDFVQREEADRPLAQRDQSGAVSYYLADHLSSVVQTTNGTGTVTLTREYDPWGNLLQGGAVGGYAFTGREWDPETGLYYYRARYYDPKVGRFLGEDPVSFQGTTPYGYVEGRVTLFTDPSGMVMIKDRERVHYLPDIDPQCSAAGAEDTAGGCERVDYRPDIKCDGCGTNWTASVTVTLVGDIYVYDGSHKWPYKNRLPVDTKVTSTERAEEHEYNHVSDKVNAILPIFRALEAQRFLSEGECEAAASKAMVEAGRAYDAAAKESQKRRH
jgi:RHS repeat-associated protein